MKKVLIVDENGDTRFSAHVEVVKVEDTSGGTVIRLFNSEDEAGVVKCDSCGWKARALASISITCSNGKVIRDGKEYAESGSWYDLKTRKKVEDMNPQERAVSSKTLDIVINALSEAVGLKGI